MPGHVILYRSGLDSRVNRANITRLKRIVQKSTTPVRLEIYYHEPLKLLDWAEPHDRVRYVRLRNGDPFPVAERIASADTHLVVVFDDSLLIAAADVWQLLGLVARQPVTVLLPRHATRAEYESRTAFFLREARLELSNYLFASGNFAPMAFALNKDLFPVSRRSIFQQKQAYQQLLRSVTATEPGLLAAHSRACADTGESALLGTGLRTSEAFTTWLREKKFPWWFSYRSPLFHVAQLAVYYGALVFYLSPRSALLVFLFAILITPQYFFARLNWRKWRALPARLAARFLLYFAG